MQHQNLTLSIVFIASILKSYAILCSGLTNGQHNNEIIKRDNSTVGSTTDSSKEDEHDNISGSSMVNNNPNRKYYNNPMVIDVERYELPRREPSPEFVIIESSDSGIDSCNDDEENSSSQVFE